jgi:hypothetical protein
MRYVGMRKRIWRAGGDGLQKARVELRVAFCECCPDALRKKQTQALAGAYKHLWLMMPVFA